MLDVAIAGGGPGGLACAHALRRTFKDVKLKVFERTPEYKPQGAIVLLNVNGANAVKALDPELLRRFEVKSNRINGVQMFTKTGELVDTVTESFDSIESRFGVRPFTLTWYDMRNELYNMLPQGTVEFSSQVTTAVDRGDHAELVVRTDGSGVEDVVKARVVVGADGYYSRIRQYCIGDGPPVFGGMVMWRARVPWRPGLPTDMPRRYLDGEFGVGRIVSVLPCSGSAVVWTALCPAALLSSMGLDYDHATRAVQDTSLHCDREQEGLIQRVLKVYHDFSPDFLYIVSNTPPESITEHGLFMRNPDTLPELWGLGHVTLLGDAAHATLPNGQGCNLSFEDAVVLTHNLQRHGFSPKALRSYEAERTPRLREMMAFKEMRATPEEQQMAFEFTMEPLRQSTGDK